MTSERKFHIVNFGCRASQSEGAAIHAELTANAVPEADSPFDAQVLVINSCTVTEEADREVRRLIRRVSRRSPSAEIIVTGCYAQRRPEELASMPGVRYVVGNSHKAMVGSLVRRIPDSQANLGRAEVFCSDVFSQGSLSGPVFHGSAGRTRVVVKVQDGCNATCAFCIIPKVRGASRSRLAIDVIDEVGELVVGGFREVVFSGIHLGSYGRDLESRSTLGALIRRTLQEVPDLERLRLSSIEPLEVTEEIIGLVADNPRIAPHLHVPLQSGSSPILQAMRRPYTAEYYARLVAGIRQAVPDAAIGADVMVGFPGETEEDFQRTYRLIEDSPLTYLHVFPYSPRPGTAAAEMQARVSDVVARSRGQQLRQLMAEKNLSFRRRLVGRQMPVLILDGEAERGWRPAISVNFVRVRAPAELKPNRWYQLPIARVNGDGLEAGLSQDSMTTTAAETV